ncbi:MAG: cupredoxin domain-containing protein [Rickettsiales bacterium]|nr:cupredoxin domain-containing protein [Rickettsiales bacterium]
MFKVFFIVFSLFFTVSCQEEEVKQEYIIVLKNHKFNPEIIEVNANEKFKLIIDNQDSTAEEFESHDLKREKIIKGNTKSVVFVGKLEVGEYGYFGEFNEDEAQGKIVVK